MYIDNEKCVQCKRCIPYCPREAIVLNGEELVIDLKACVECGICKKFALCPKDAIYNVDLVEPRVYRKSFSDPQGKHHNTPLKHAGRGTEEVKTNDVTGIVNTLDQITFAVEMGRPGVGASFRDIEKVAKAVVPYVLKFEANNPVTSMIMDKTTGAMDPTILEEVVLSAILEFSCRLEDAYEVLESLKVVAKKIDTVFSLCIICRVDEKNNTVPVMDIVESLGVDLTKSSAKTNMGLGRPRYEDRIKEEK